MEWLRQQPGVEIVPGLEDPEEAVRDGREDIAVVISEDFADRFRSARPAPVSIVSDGSRTTTRATLLRVRSLFQQYSSEIATMRLVVRGVSPAAASALDIEDVEVSSAQQRAAAILNFIPLFMVLAAFTGGMQIATDSTAGERERGSFEPLLVNPAPRGAIAAGKWLAAAAAASISVLLTTALCVVVLRFIPLHEVGIRFRFGPDQAALMLAAILPMCLLSAAIQTYLATFARSFKEAQTYMGFLIMAPMAPGVLSVIYPLGDNAWMYPAPFLGQHVLLSAVLGGKTPAAVWFLTAAAASIILSLVLVRLTTNLFRQERIIFGR
jgi:sodium transport system permease protein